jgi:hypothetical protein
MLYRPPLPPPRNFWDSPIGKLAVRLKLDSYYSNCKCMTHSLDFSDPCNSMYLGIL